MTKIQSVLKNLKMVIFLNALKNKSKQSDLNNLVLQLIALFDNSAIHFNCTVNYNSDFIVLGNLNVRLFKLKKKLKSIKRDSPDFLQCASLFWLLRITSIARVLLHRSHTYCFVLTKYINSFLNIHLLKYLLKQTYYVNNKIQIRYNEKVTD